MAAAHAIHEEFPDAAARRRRLKVPPTHFARLLDGCDPVNGRVFGAESRHAPMSGAAGTGLRRNRAGLRDEIARIPAGAPA